MTIRGGDDVRRRLKSIQAASDEAMALGLMAGGEVLRELAVQNLRSNGLWDTGTLARSIRVERVS